MESSTPDTDISQNSFSSTRRPSGAGVWVVPVAGGSQHTLCPAPHHSEVGGEGDAHSQLGLGVLMPTALSFLIWLLWRLGNRQSEASLSESEVSQATARLPLQTQTQRSVFILGRTDPFEEKKLSFLWGETTFTYHLGNLRKRLTAVYGPIWSFSGFPWKCEDQWITTWWCFQGEKFSRK